MPTIHRVSQGECISSIADQHGLFWQTVWNHADNAELKTLRKDPNCLLEGDQVTIPDKAAKEESCGTEQLHKFRMKGVPAKIKVRILRDDQPRKDTDYVLEIDGTSTKGKTNGDGYIEADIPPGARTAKVEVGTGDDIEVFELQLGTVDPLDTESGVIDRLSALGYNVSEPKKAISDFQAAEELEVTGEVDDQTREKLKERFGQ